MKKEHGYLLILAFIWGTSFLFQKVLTPQFGPAITAGVRLFVGGLFLVIIARIQKNELLKKEYIKPLFVFGIINGAIPLTAFAASALLIPSTFSVLINSMTPMATALLMYFILKERLTYIQGVGLLLGITGIAVSTSQGGITLTQSTLLGILICFGAIFCYAYCFTYYRKHSVNIPSAVLGGMSQVIGGSVILFISIFWHPTVIKVNMSNITVLLAFAILCSGIAYYIFYEIQKALSPLETSLVTLIVPLVGITLGVVILHEPLTLGFMLGSIVTLFGVFCILILNNWHGKLKKRQA